MPDATFRGSKDDLMARLQGVRAALAGEDPRCRDIAHDLATDLGAEILRLLREDFDTKSEGGTGVDGVTWEPLSEDYARQQGRDKPIGKRTERLAESLKIGGPGNVFDPQPGEVTVGTEVPYAEFFHATRPIFPEDIPPQWREKLTPIVRHAFARVIERLLLE